MQQVFRLILRLPSNLLSLVSGDRSDVPAGVGRPTGNVTCLLLCGVGGRRLR
jgi:hypothetical protein